MWCNLNWISPGTGNGSFLMVVFLICIIFYKNDFFSNSRCPIPLYAKVEKLILLFSNLVGHTFALNVFRTHSTMNVGLKQ